MVHVEIHDGDALRAMRGLGVARGDRDIVDEAETHGRLRAGVMARRPRRDERRIGVPAHDRVHGGDGPARGAPDRLHGFRAHDRIAVERGVALFRLRLFERRKVTFGMDAQQRLARGARGRSAQESLEAIRVQLSFNRA